MSRILVVDDSKVMRDMIVACLRARPGHSFTHATNGIDALECLSLGRFDLMVLDLHMPDVGGIEVLDFVRRQDALRVLPILVVTTRGDEDSRRGALAAGASGFMAKPFTAEAILAEADALLAVPERGDPEAQGSLGSCMR